MVNQNKSWGDDLELEMNAFQKITQLYSQMSQSQQLIADVILQDPETVAFFNVSELAKKANVSDSTVTRFATFIGYSGFPALSRALQEYVRSRLTTSERFQLSRTVENDNQRMVLNCFEDDIQNITLLMDRIDLEAFERVIHLLVSARKIGIICARSSVSLGLFFEFYLQFLEKDVTLLTGDPRTLDILHRFTPEDVFVGIGFSRYSRFTIEGLHYGNQKGVKTIAITDYPSSPLVTHSKEVLYTPTGIASHLDSFAAPISLITSILRVMAQRIPEKVSESLTIMEDIWEGFGIYTKPSK